MVYLSIYSSYSFKKYITLRIIMMHSIVLFLTIIYSCLACRTCVSRNLSNDLDWSNLEKHISESKLNLQGFEKPLNQLSEIKEYYYLVGEKAGQLILLLAYTDWKNKKYERSLSRIKYFLQFYGQNENTDFALYMKAFLILKLHEKRAFLINQDPSERDNEAFYEAYSVFSELVLHFPYSKYVIHSKKKMVQLSNIIAMKEIHIANHYYQNGAYLASIKRAKLVINDFENTIAARKAYKILIKSYKALNDCNFLIPINSFSS